MSVAKLQCGSREATARHEIHIVLGTSSFVLLDDPAVARQSICLREWAISIRPATGTSSRPRTPVPRLYSTRRIYPCQRCPPTPEFIPPPPSNTFLVGLPLEHLSTTLACLAPRCPLHPLSRTTMAAKRQLARSLHPTSDIY